MSMNEYTNAHPEARIVQMAAFRVGSEEYVIDIMRIKEIINPLKITGVPSASALIEGVINLRGVIIPVIDLRKRFAVPLDRYFHQPKYIIIILSGRIVGLIADEVLEVVRVPRNTIKPSPQLSNDRLGSLCLGVCEYSGRLLLLIDVKKVVSPLFSLPGAFQGQVGPTKTKSASSLEGP